MPFQYGCPHQPSSCRHTPKRVLGQLTPVPVKSVNGPAGSVNTTHRNRGPLGLSVGAPRSASPCAFHELSIPTPIPPSAGPPMVSPISDSAPTASLRAAAATFISRPAIRLLSRLPISHAPSILYSGFTSFALIPACVTSQINSLTHQYEAPLQYPIMTTWTYSAKEKVQHCLHVVLTTIRSN